MSGNWSWFCAAGILAFPFPLGLMQCDRGYYCPNLIPGNNWTLPQICPPTVACQLDRLGSEFCEPQGVFEPWPCPPGSYCPNASVMLECPAGSYCIRGSYEPKACAAAAHCPAGSSKSLDFTGLIISLVLDALIAVFVLVSLRAWTSLPALPAWAAERLPALPALPAALDRALGLTPRSQKWKRRRGGGPEAYAALGGEESASPSPLGFEPTFGAALLQVGTAAAAASAADADGAVEAASVLQAGFVKCNPGVRLDLRFENLSFTLPPPLRRTILQGVTGSIACNRVTGVLGPSGAGKTSFMNVLMGKLPRTSGRIFVNGREEEIYKYRQSIGYVPQDDTMIRELTVRENILFSARMRLPRLGWTDDDVQQHVDAVIEVLGLTACANTLVGDATERGVSGGQRKRTNIGIELAAAPAAIFLDEPTSGLDSSAAMEVCMSLRALANLGITVVAIIHQPRLEIFESIDDLVLLCPGGVPAYVGPRAEAMAYFVKLGYAFTTNNNPADELMDFLSGDKAPPQLALPTPAAGAAAAPAYLRGLEPHTALLHSCWLARHERHALPAGASAAGLADALLLSASAAPLSPGASLNGGAGDAGVAPAPAPPISLAFRGATFGRQVVLVHQRSMLQQFRNSSTFVLEMGVAVLAGTMMGAASSQVPSLYLGILKPPYTLISPAPIEVLLPSLGFYVAVAVGLAGSPAGVLTFGEEKLMYYREAAAGHDKLAYYIGKTWSTVYRIIVGGLHFAGVFVLLARPTSSFATIFAIVVVQFYCVYGLAATVSMVVKREQAALLSVIATLVAATMCGYGPSLTQFRAWNLGWLIDMSYARWAVEALFDAETQAYRAHYMVTEVSAPLFGYDLDRFGLDMTLMLLIGLIYRVVAYGLLTRLNVEKQR